MFKNIFWMALMCLPLPLCASISLPADSIPETETVVNTLPPDGDDLWDSDSILMELDDVVVSAARTIVKSDRKLLYPQRGQIEGSTSGLDLINRLHLPGLSINPVFGTINLTGGRSVQLRRNGVLVSEKEIAAIPPSDIVRIEYIDSPGPRYEGADVVINVLTRRNDSGGNVSGEFMNAIGNGKFASIDDVAFSHGHGPSELAVNASWFMMTRDNWVRDYNETRHYADGTVEERREVGIPVKIGNSGLVTDVNYSYTPSESDMLNVRFNLGWDLIPYNEEGDRHSYLYTSTSPLPVEIKEHSSERSLTPALSLYYRHAFSRGESLTFEVTGTRVNSRSKRRYSERGEGRPEEDVVSDNRGRSNSLIAEGVWEKNISAWTFLAGGRHLQRLTSDRYAGTVAADITVRQAEISLYAGLSRRGTDWSASLSLKGSRIYSRQENVSRSDYAFQPEFVGSYSPVASLTIRYSAGLSASSPAVAMMSDVEQIVDAGMVVRGNPGLKAYRTFNQRFNLGFNHHLFDVDWTVGFSREYNPVMGEIIREGTLFVKTYANQRSFDCLSSELNLLIHPFGDYLTLSLSPLFNRYISRGNTYTHTCNMFRFRWDLDVKFGNWVLSYNTFMGPSNRMYGEEIIEEKNMNMILAGYVAPTWSLQLGAFDPFMKTYWMETRNLSEIAPYTSRAYCHKNPYFTIKASFSLNYGKKQTSASPTPHLNTADDNQGLMKGFK
ncbi:TonB-dependent receptor [uncultured Duncaniella sp.]|uniref:TonB-dependent receptor n=2 Tax=uncultured Duncaniella sp. TaxID=2768039 RepID=UPI0025DD8233|nr:TonB-dependent receptor [uncultured Duncaniella sp.]